MSQLFSPTELTAYERDVIRPHVFGTFRELIGATAKSPAMLFYLDNWLSTRPMVNDAERIRPGAGNGRPAAGNRRLGAPVGPPGGMPARGPRLTAIRSR